MIATPQDAIKWPCPTARTFAEAQPNCRADDCPLWRWKPLDASVMKAAIAAEMGRNGLDHRKATAVVAADPVAHGVPAGPTHGWCGLGGEPKA